MTTDLKSKYPQVDGFVTYKKGNKWTTSTSFRRYWNDIEMITTYWNFDIFLHDIDTIRYGQYRLDISFGWYIVASLISTAGIVSGDSGDGSVDLSQKSDDSSAHTALHLAAKSGHQQIILYLLQVSTVFSLHSFVILTIRLFVIFVLLFCSEWSSTDSLR